MLRSAQRRDATGFVPSRTQETTEAYRVTRDRLFKQAAVESDDLRGLIDWFAKQHDVWAPATIRQYRAALILGIEEWRAPHNELDALPLIEKLKNGPRPRMRGPRRTSARKRKSVPLNEFSKLVTFLNNSRHPDGKLAARLLKHNVRLFLRPAEWRLAVVVGSNLVIENAKATNGRSFGPKRTLDLTDYGKVAVQDLVGLLAALKESSRSTKELNRMWTRLASRAARACSTLGIRRISPYSTRHFGMSQAKTWMSLEEVAAAAGHKVTTTAGQHYAKRRSAWRVKLSGFARPSVEDVAKVKSSPKATRESNLAKISASQTPTSFG
jgi:integrase